VWWLIAKPGQTPELKKTPLSNFYPPI